MLKRSPFGSKLPPPRPVKQYMGDHPSAPRTPALRVVDTRSILVVPLPKENALQHLGYMALVRLLPCARCGFYRKGFIQFCHADEGKGTGIKTDCRRGWPGCAPHDGLPGCHWVVGTSGQLAKATRRRFELSAAMDTRMKISQSGAWPTRLPRWME